MTLILNVIGRCWKTRLVLSPWFKSQVFQSKASGPLFGFWRCFSSVADLKKWWNDSETKNKSRCLQLSHLRLAQSGWLRTCTNISFFLSWTFQLQFTHIQLKHTVDTQSDLFWSQFPLSALILVIVLPYWNFFHIVSIALYYINLVLSSEVT